ncbi:MAG: DNA (cytosine-5-)-methyltransferase [Oscillospiraceae bacterium]|nr:DNA (cytosine-5-)-methyltransferase [Oscillospiraceae bacterium]
MFAGIGGFRAGLDRAGGFQCVGHCEIDKYADASYRAIHTIREEEKYYPDARTIDPRDLPDFDLLCGGFPCQSFSLSGKRQGFHDTRGTLFFALARLVEARRPAYLWLENVVGLLSHDGCRTFCTILTTLHDLGYGLEWCVLNSADFVPQSRRRVFIIGYLDSRCTGKIFPVSGAKGKALIQILGGPQGSRVYDPAGVSCTQTASAGGMGGKTGLYLIDLCAGEPRQTEIARCITARYGQTSLSTHPRERSGVLVEGTPTEPGAAVHSFFRRGRIRRLMPRECLRLQGFAEDQIDRLLAITSDSQAYKQAGNSVTVNVIEAIGRRLRSVDEQLRKEDTA